MNKTLLAGQGSKRAPLKNRRHSLVEFCTYKLFTDVTIGALLGPGQDNEMCIRGPTIMKGYIWLWANHSTLLKATYWRPGYPWLPVSVFRSVNHQRVAYVTNFLYMHLKIVTLNWNRGIHNKLKSRGLIYSGFHLKVRISIKLQNSQCFWRGWGRGGGGRREKYLLHNKVLFIKSPKTSRKLLYFDLKSEFVTCAYVITLCILFLESIAVSSMKFVAVSWSG